ncbi:putative quorum-quenching lactonase YtnP [compost metagenome]
MHFDHCGGSIERKGDQLVPAFKNATYWSNEDHWKWAVYPNDREKASFLKENILPIQESGQLKFIEHVEGTEFAKDFNIRFMYGHTDAMMLPQLNYKGRTVVFCADLLPSTGHLPIPYVMGYDTRPLETLTEKKAFLNEAAEKDFILFFEHDSVNECCTLQQTEKGVRVKDIFKLSEI